VIQIVSVFSHGEATSQQIEVAESDREWRGTDLAILRLLAFISDTEWTFGNGRISAI